MIIIFNKKLLFMFVSILALSFVLAACGGDDSGSDDGGGETADGEFAEQEWRFVSEEVPGEVQYEYTAEFADRISEKTDGAITIEPIEYGGLGSEVDQAQMLQQGAVEFAVMSPGFTGGQVPDGQIFSLHYFFPSDQEQVQQILTDSEALNEDLRAKYEEHSITPLSFWTEGAMAWTSNVGIESPSDWEGLNTRVQESPLMRESYAAYGATVQSMSQSELYTALDRETVDGQENPLFYIESASFNEVQDTLTISNHNNYVAMTTVNTEWYNGLDDSVKEVIDETVAEMQDWVFEEQQSSNQEALDAMVDDTENPTEVIELTEDQIAEFSEVAEPVHQYYRDEVEGIDPELFDKLQQEIEDATGE
ncbi:TRAP transporter substrate-binding protein DctP [Gracilibacillus phocaeensis]|uniref:TRAP transporter substrate-binding protein DctP n=2 Tax=Gracilibacillus TaxID=74385 RepID=UPI00082670E4|nr:TRAP transporter substrate-binding protein DctP [Gracilibacillus phocaeensis]